ncbi:hypothetical protein LQ757_10870 [Agromyces sp. SYSU K20354]|uniref:hypothetical protein n=1 Tax=Agromyces cavernae TaxID=2898659 RepID=UPI001E56743D|nr:hypothetical protein [Agromyces cavernae]MCD2442775.1 hypothetical protein [Agromyces cavernae]
MPARQPLPSHLDGVAFHVHETEFHGVTPKRLRGRDLQRPFTGVRSVGLDLTSISDRALAYAPLLRPGDAFSHSTAAELLGLPLPASTPELHIISQPGVARARARGVVGHEASEPFESVLLDVHPIVPATLAWCQLAGSLGRDDLVALGDAIVGGRRRSGGRRSDPLATHAQLAIAVQRWGRRRSARRLASALPLIRTGVDSRPETLTRLCLIDAGLPEPLVNNATIVGDGRVLHPDLKWRDVRILFEYEGDGHRTDRRRWKQDLARKGDFEAAGWIVIRVTSDDLFVDRAAFIARVRSVIRLAERRLASLGSGEPSQTAHG